MSSSDAHEVVVSEYAQTVIRVKARRLCRRPGFGRSEEDRVRQDLSLLLLTKLEQFNPERATLNTFVDRVVESGVRMFLRSARRLKRHGGRVAESLDAAGPACPTRPLRDFVGQDAHARRTGATSPDPRDEFVDRDAIQHVLDLLSPEDRALCERLLEIEPTPLAAELGMSRRQMRQAIARLREQFCRVGFGNPSESRTQPSESA